MNRRLLNNPFQEVHEYDGRGLGPSVLPKKERSMLNLAMIAILSHA